MSETVPLTMPPAMTPPSHATKTVFVTEYGDAVEVFEWKADDGNGIRLQHTYSRKTGLLIDSKGFAMLFYPPRTLSDPLL